MDDYTYSLYAEGAYYYTYHGYAKETNDYSGFDAYYYDSFDYYYDNYEMDTGNYYNPEYYSYYLSNYTPSTTTKKKGLFATIKSWFKK